MSNVLQQLQGDEPAILMYLAGEFSAEDRAEFERRLAGDAALRAKVDAMRTLHGEVFTAVEKLDESGAPSVNTAASIRQVSRMMQQWTVDRARRGPAARAPERLLRFPWWSYPITAAAAIVVAFLVWSTNRPVGQPPVADGNDSNGPGYNTGPVPLEFADRLTFGLERSFGATDEPADPDSNLDRLSDAEGEVIAVASGKSGPGLFEDESSDPAARE